MPARGPSGGGCSCIGGKAVDEVDDVLEVDGRLQLYRG